MWCWRLTVLAAVLAASVPAHAATLYDDLGGQNGVARIVAGMVDVAAADPRTADRFDNIDRDRLKTRIALHMCQVADGGCVYTGISMRGAHAGLDLTQRHFNALVESLQIAMDRQQIGFHTQNRLLARLAPMQREVITR